MQLPNLVILVVYFAVHGQTADVIDYGQSDITTVILLVSDLSRQIEDMKEIRAKDVARITSLEQKYENILHQNSRLRKRVGILENLRRPFEHQGSYRSEQSQPEYHTRHSPGKLIIDEIRNWRNTSDDKNVSNNTTERRWKSIYAESARDAFSGAEMSTITPVTARTGRYIESDHLLLGLSQRVGASTDNIVAFSAYLSHTILEPGSDYLIKYDHVVTNAGNGYSPVTGAFTCPEDGVYIITWTTSMANQGFIQTDLMKNGVSVGYSFIAFQSNYPDMGSQTSVLVLSRGDLLTIKITSKTSKPALYYKYTSFSGFLLN